MACYKVLCNKPKDHYPRFQVQRDVADILAPHLTSDGLVLKCLQYAAGLDHVMDFTKMRALNSLFSMLNQGARNIITYNQQHPDFPMTVGAKLLTLTLMELDFPR